MEHEAVAGSAEQGAAEEHLGAQGRRLSVAGDTAGTLKFPEQVEQHQDAEESRFGSEELPQAEIVRGQVLFQLLDAMLDAGALVVVAPDLLRRLPDWSRTPERCNREPPTVSAPASARSAQLLPDHHKAPLPIPPPELQPELAHRVGLVQRPPLLHPRRLPL